MGRFGGSYINPTGGLVWNHRISQRRGAKQRGHLGPSENGNPSPVISDPHAADWVKSLNLTLGGSRKQHILQVQADTGLTPFSQRRAITGSATFSGGISQLNRPGKPWGWRGEVQALKLEGMWSPMRSLTLQEAAPLSVAAKWVWL